MSIFLGRIFAQYTQTVRGQKQEVIDNFLAGMTKSAENELPATYQEARSRLLPIVRSRTDTSIARILMSRHEANGRPSALSELAQRPFVHDLVAGIGFDTPAAISRVTVSQLQTWGVDVDAVLADAADNLRSQTRPDCWTPLGPSIWAGEWDDSYASSRMLTPEVIHQLGLAEPLAMIPSPEFLLVADGRNEKAFEILAHWADVARQRNNRQLSYDVYRLRERDWEVVEVPPERGSAILNLQAESLAASYGDQKQLLEDLHKTQGVDVWVATVNLFSEKSTELVKSLSIWTQGVETLLPATDWVVLQELDEQGENVVRRLTVAFKDIESIASGVLQRHEDLEPPRYRTVGFPSQQQWDDLSKVEVDLQQ